MIVLRKHINGKRITNFGIYITKLVFVLVLLVGCGNESEYSFDGIRAYEYVQYQTDLGPRTIGSEAHSIARSWFVEILKENGWDVILQEGDKSGVKIHNVIASRGQQGDWIIIGAHYDSRSVADKDPDVNNRTKPVVGANDGASGAAVLLELSRILPVEIDTRLSLVFFDAEDNGGVQGQEWILGSKFFVENLQTKPDSVIIIDMIGDADLNIFFERNSDPGLSRDIWRIAADLEYSDYFIPEYKYRIIDDHIPFIEAGIKAIDIIDFDYPYWHTSYDTADKVSPESLSVIGNTLLEWLMTYEDN